MKHNKDLLHMALLFLLLTLFSTSCTFQIINPPPPKEVALKSFHGRYVTALGEEDDWVLTQNTELGPCGRFTLHYQANGKIALETCYGWYITAPSGCDTRRDCMLRQKPKRGDAEQFDLYELGNDTIAFRTREGRSFTAGDAGQGWEEGLAWSVVAETKILRDWEEFTLLQQP
jgi:hypothetical protein